MALIFIFKEVSPVFDVKVCGLCGCKESCYFPFSTDVDGVLDEIVAKEPLVTPSRMDQVRKLIIRLQQKLAESDDHHFYLFKVISSSSSILLRLVGM